MESINLATNNKGNIYFKKKKENMIYILSKLE